MVAADVYSMEPHVGRGGWTWYTRSAGWQRAGVESLLGLRLRGSNLEIDPCIPRAWKGFEATVKHRSSQYRVTVENPGGMSRGVASCELDRVAIVGTPSRIPLVDDGGLPQIKVRLG